MRSISNFFPLKSREIGIFEVPLILQGTQFMIKLPVLNVHIYITILCQFK